MYLPEVIILSTQRSGTHLLESFLRTHPRINGRGELFLKYLRHGEIEKNLEGRVNTGILMYDQIPIFHAFDGDFINHKVIHLFRDPYDVALSRAQMIADKRLFGQNYRAHMKRSNVDNPDFISNHVREAVDTDEVNRQFISRKAEQDYFREFMQSITHLELRYEDFVPDNKTVSVMNRNISKKILDFIGLEEMKLTTDYIKTGIAGKM